MAAVASFFFFIIAAVFGLINLVTILRNQRTNGFLVLAHGTFAVIALLILISFVAAGHSDSLLVTSISLFVLAALGGFTLLTIDLSKKPIPKKLALLHPVFAVSALIFLTLYLLKHV